MPGISTAEKRAELGDDWPDCECHDQPMYWRRNYKPAGKDGWFYCKVRVLETQQALRQRRQTVGKCAYCNRPLDTETMCEYHASRHNTLMGKAKHSWKHQLNDAAYRRRKREKENGKV